MTTKDKRKTSKETVREYNQNQPSNQSATQIISFVNEHSHIEESAPSDIMNIGGVDCYEKNGIAYLKLETVARGLGFTKTETKNGTKYTTVRWERVFGFLDEIGFDHKWTKKGYVPENIFYRLAMKAKNSVAEAFQAKVADEIIPAIRKHGTYMTPETIEKVLYNPDFLIKIATTLKAEQEKNKKLLAQKQELQTENQELKTTNKALLGEIQKWDYKPLITKLVRVYSARTANGMFGVGWNQL